MRSAAKNLPFLVENKQTQIPRGVYPELLRFAQDRSNWSERARDDVRRDLFQRPTKPVIGSAGPAESIESRPKAWVGATCWVLILGVALGSLRFFYTRGLSNIYGDSLAHMEGARRLFDSLTPGYIEIGTGWLPAFHLLVSPLAVNDYLWRTGLAGSLVSMVAFVLAARFLFRLSLEMNRSLAAGCVTLASVLLCPNMLYLAATPLTESLAIMASVLTVYGLFRFQLTGGWRALVGSALAAFLGTLTRYDVWYLLPFAGLFVLLARRAPWRERLRGLVVFGVIAGAGPALWFAHNAIRFGDPLEFYSGQYSAKAIYAHQLATTGFRYPTDGSLLLSARYYLEDCRLTMGALPLELAVLGLIAWLVDRSERSRRVAALLLLVPLPFYAHSMAHASIPLYVPTLSPNTYYNLRYGLEMLPAVAIFPSFLLAPRLSRRARGALLAVIVAALGAQAISTASRGANELVVVKEGILNTPCRSPRQQAIIRCLRRDYDGRLIIVSAGKWPCVNPVLGIPFRKTLSEANSEQWQDLRRGVTPAVGWIIRGDGDRVDQLMRAYPEAFRDFQVIEQLAEPGEGSVQIYRRVPGKR